MPTPKVTRRRRSRGDLRAVACLLAAACAAGPRPVDGPLEARWDAVQVALRSNDWARALEMADSLEKAADGTSMAERAAALSELAAARYVQAEVERASWTEAPRQWVSVGEEVGVLLHIENPTDRTLVFEDAHLPWWNLLGHNEDLASLWEFTLETLDQDAVGNAWKDTVRVHREAGPAMTLAPGESAIVMWADVVRTPFAVLRRLQLGAILLPGSTMWGGRRIPLRRIRVPKAEILAYPRGVEELMDSPLGSLRKALAVDTPGLEPHIALSARFLAEDEREEGIASLIASLDESTGERLQAVLTGLLWSTGHTALGRDPAAWRSWWKAKSR